MDENSFEKNDFIPLDSQFRGASLGVILLIAFIFYGDAAAGYLVGENYFPGKYAGAFGMVASIPCGVVMCLLLAVVVVRKNKNT